MPTGRGPSCPGLMYFARTTSSYGRTISPKTLGSPTRRQRSSMNAVLAPVVTAPRRGPDEEQSLTALRLLYCRELDLQRQAGTTLPQGEGLPANATRMSSRQHVHVPSVQLSLRPHVHFGRILGIDNAASMRYRGCTLPGEAPRRGESQRRVMRLDLRFMTSIARSDW